MPAIANSEFNVVLDAQGGDLPPNERSVLLGAAGCLAEFATLPGFDPAEHVVRIEFSNGKTGSARLTRSPG